MSRMQFLRTGGALLEKQIRRELEQKIWITLNDDTPKTLSDCIPLLDGVWMSPSRNLRLAILAEFDIHVDDLFEQLP